MAWAALAGGLIYSTIYHAIYGIIIILKGGTVGGPPVFFMCVRGLGFEPRNSFENRS